MDRFIMQDAFAYASAATKDQSAFGYESALASYRYESTAGKREALKLARKLANQMGLDMTFAIPRSAKAVHELAQWVAAVLFGAALEADIDAYTGEFLSSIKHATR